jgi:hypothetical protein
MKNESPREAGKKAAAWLATCFVVGGGLTFCVMISVAFFEKPARPLSIIAGVTAAFGALAWLLRDRSESEGSTSLLTWLFRRDDNHRHKVAYRLSRREEKIPPSQLGSNAPPSVERLRDLSEGVNNWVPNDRRLQRA